MRFLALLILFVMREWDGGSSGALGQDMRAMRIFALAAARWILRCAIAHHCLRCVLPALTAGVQPTAPPSMMALNPCFARRVK
jgi:hypothetical protein